METKQKTYSSSLTDSEWELLCHKYRCNVDEVAVAWSTGATSYQKDGWLSAIWDGSVIFAVCPIKLIRIASEWRFQNRADLEAVVRVEFLPELAPQLLAEHSGISVDYHYCLYYRQY